MELDPYRSVQEQLVEKITELEAQLKGAGPAVDLGALPLAALQNHLELEWLPDGGRLMQRKTITSEEIGELPSTRLRRTADYAFAAGAAVEIPWQVADYDIGGQWNQANRVIIKVPGKYVIVANAVVEVTAPGIFGIGIWHRPIIGGLNSIAEASQDVPAGGSPVHSHSVATIQHLSTGDQVSAYGQYNAGASRWYVNTATNFELHWVGT